ncbi:MAG: hypothetical protein U1C56_00405 [Candidatus Curtissbacteria bacterium]|nr:hypothetical protein [Candidatus Curtissbacteria bacterium]
MDILDLEDQLSKFIYELETEDRLVRVGLKDTAESSKIYKKYKSIFTEKNLSEIQALISKTKNPGTRDIYKRIYFTIAGSFIGLATASSEDQITTYFSGAKVKVAGEEIPYYELMPRISKDTVFEKREILDDAGTSVVSKVNSKRLKLVQDELKLIKKLGFSDYVDYFSKGKKMDYAKFYKVVNKITKETDKIWNKVMFQVSQEVFKRPFVNIRSCHLAYLRSISMYDNYYPKEKVVPTFLKWTQDIGLADLIPSIQIDDRDRPKKNPRAVCYWPKPPEEIHLVIKPIGGEQDFEALFHEGGHALHGASVSVKLPYTLRALAHSNALTETYAFLLEDMVFDPDFLTSYLNVSSFTGNKIKWQAYFVNLMMLRRYLGKFSYEYEMFSKGAISKGPLLYSKNLQRTTGFITKRENWLADMDGGFYSADYLRAWISAAQIHDYIKRKFGKKWFVNGKTGEFLRKLYSRGVTDEIEDVVTRLGYKPWDTSYLISGYRDVLGKGE